MSGDRAILQQCRDHIARAHCRGALARSEGGQIVQPVNNPAWVHSVCVMGALDLYCENEDQHNKLWSSISRVTEREYDETPTALNDHYETADMLRCLDLVIAEASDADV